MRTVITSLLIFTISNMLLAQVDVNKVFSNPENDIGIEELSEPIHVVAAYDTLIWAADYGSGSVYKSIDNGKSFKKISTLGAEYFESIQFVDDKNGFISGDYGYEYKTQDGGETWIEISPKIEGRIKERFRNDTTKNQEPDGAFAAYYSMHFISKAQGYVSGFMFNPKVGAGASFKRLFFLTNDGGENWELPDGKEQANIRTQFKNSIQKHNISVENEYFLNNVTSWKLGRDKINRSKDIIVRRNYSTNVSDTLKLPKTPYQSVKLRSITFLNDETGFVFGGSLDKQNERAVIYRTTNGGESWEYIDSNLSHIHSAITNNGYLFLFGENGLTQRIDIQETINN